MRKLAKIILKLINMAILFNFAFIFLMNFTLVPRDASAQPYSKEFAQRFSPVVKIYNARAKTTGTGFFVTTKRGDYIFTNAHVCMGEHRYYKGDIQTEPLEIKYLNKGTYVSSDYDLTQEAINLEEDFCALRIKSTFMIAGYSSYKLGEFNDKKNIKTVDMFKGRSVSVPSSRYEKDSLGLGDKYSKMTNRDNSYIFDHWCRPGMSGSPILNEEGEVVAMVSSCVKPGAFNSRNIGEALLSVSKGKRLEGRGLNWAKEVLD